MKLMTSPNQNFRHPTLQLLQKCKTLTTLKQIHAQMIQSTLTLHTYPLSKLLYCSSTLDIPHTLSIFNQIQNPTIFLFNTLISSFANQTQHTHLAFSLYNSVLCHNSVKPNSYTYPSLFKACGLHPWVQYGLALHTHVVKFLEPVYDQFVQASLVNYYANIGKLSLARYIFDQISKPDLATWNSMLAAYARNASLSFETLSLFNTMQSSGVKPNEVTFVALISACANLGAFNEGAWAHVYILKSNNLRLNSYAGTSLIELYSKCGFLDIAHQLFDKLSQRDTLCYNAMIGGFAIHGFEHKALDLYENMRLEGFVPDNATFIVTMCACSHVGLVEEGCEIFESIKKVYGVEPTLEHYGCVVDLLSRAGRFTEVKHRVESMPMKPNAIIWRSILGGARIYGNLEMGEFALKQLMEVEPETSGNYVLLSNMYASIDKWEDVKRVRKLMKDHGVIKMPGHSLVDRDLIEG
ncbi:pentatricopeptide repeat-containing protein At5g43790-like [Mercurialis annua]|uniref:pentatricopeptide repeat-containing protein At5g43790-like n=1 Tax=Mercurialis annua TaxID=3986 RepID=UPI00215E14DA|nr:pentatricopeptide repeat-containing protein At5g43790-like [Mercurialis annua]